MAGLDVFVGRAVLLRTLQTGLEQGRSFALFGGPKTGRTSALLQLVHGARQRLSQGSASAKIVPVYVDLATCPGERPQALAAKLWEAIKEAVLDPYVQQHPAPPRPGSADPGRSPQPWTVLQELLATLWEGLANTPGWCRTVLLLDNADVLTAGAWQGGDAALAALLQGPESWRPQAVVAAGGAAFGRIVARPASLWKRLRSQSLGTLRDADVQLLLRAGGLGLQDVAEVVAASGKHPQILQCLLAAWHAASGNVQGALDLAEPTIQSTCEALFATFPAMHPPRGDLPLQHALMRHLIEAGTDVSAQEVERRLHRGPIKAASDFLEQAAVVERSVRGSTTVLRAACSVWNRYYEAHSG